MQTFDPNDPSPRRDPYPSGAFANVVAAVRALDHPTEIGPYAILSVIGEGGMGTVYKADQQQPIKRTVALKVIKLGMDTRDVIARFESERQALAMMNHPNVARVLDAGATDTGRPYFVMEYVDGEPITTFADRRQLTVRQRLELFMQACDAVQHAHQKAIIHRDLKPSNILVMQDDLGPRVKVIDFGVAKAIDQRLTEKSLFTELGRFVGTPEYMSPEQAQASGRDVDTRSDVYSLGVVLYELLSGVLPFDGKSLRSAGYDEIQRIIREVDPPRPSTRLSSLGRGGEEVARCRQLPLRTLESQLKSELELIPLKAMRKERAHRYSTASELSHDISNYLADRPLTAAPESKAYRARKFMRRNKRGVLASASMLALLIVGIVATTSQAIRATRAERIARAEKVEADAQRRNAEVAADNVKEVNHFLTEDLLASAAPEVTRGREMTVRQAVDVAAETVAQRFKDRPLTEAAVHGILADTYDSLGLYDRALGHAQSAGTIQSRERGPNDALTLNAMRVTGRELTRLNRLVEAESLLRDTVAKCDRFLPADSEVTSSSVAELGTVLRRQRRFAEAEPLYRRSLAIDRGRYGPGTDEVANSLNSLAVLLADAGRDDEAEPLYREALEIRRRHGADSTYVLTTLSNLSKLAQRRGRLAEAESLMLEVLNSRRRVLKEDHPSTLLSMNDLAFIYADQKKFEQAEGLNREALARRTRVLGEDDRDTLQSLHNLGRTLVLMGKYDEAEQLLKKAVEKRRIVLGENHAFTIGSTAGLANVYEMQQRFAEARQLFEIVCQPDRLALLTDDVAALVMLRYGRCLLHVGEIQRAETVLAEALPRLAKLGTSASEATREVIRDVITILERSNRPDVADRWKAYLATLRVNVPAASQPN